MRQADEQLEQRAGFEVGVGISLNDKLQVSSVQENSPAARANVRVGETLLLVNGQSARQMPDMNYYKLVGLLNNGKIGSSITITLSKGNETRSVRLAREALGFTQALNGQDAGSSDEMWQGYDRATGWLVRVSNMRSNDIIKQLAETIAEANGAPAYGMFLDLRDLKGGSGETAARFAAAFLTTDGSILSSVQYGGANEMRSDYFIKDGKLLVKISGPRIQAQTTEIETPVGIWKGPLMLLVNGKTTGCAEFVASALSSRAQIVGKTTAGKSTSLMPITIGKSHVLFLSTGRYLTGEGLIIDGGVKPHVLIDATDDWSFEQEAKRLFSDTLPKSEQYGGKPKDPNID